jgi:hypothetical protein
MSQGNSPRHSAERRETGLIQIKRIKIKGFEVNKVNLPVDGTRSSSIPTFPKKSSLSSFLASQT